MREKVVKNSEFELGGLDFSLQTASSQSSGSVLLTNWAYCKETVSFLIVSNLKGVGRLKRVGEKDTLLPTWYVRTNIPRGVLSDRTYTVALQARHSV